MTNEEFDRRMEFILEQQAQFASDIQQLRESQVQTEQLVNRLAAVMLEGFKDVNAKIDALVDSHLRLTEAHERLSDSQARLSEAHERLSDSHERLSESHTSLSESQARLSDSQARLSESHERLSESQARLSESQARTDESLRNLIAVVDRYLSNGRN